MIHHLLPLTLWTLYVQLDENIYSAPQKNLIHIYNRTKRERESPMSRSIKQIMYLNIFCLILAAVGLLLSFLPSGILSWITPFIASLSALPIIINIAQSFISKQIPLELPVMITIILLIILGHYTAASFFVFLILIAHLLKEYILYSVEKAINKISVLLPENSLLHKGGNLVQVKNSTIVPGDIIALKTGTRAPVDGILISPKGEFDVSIITGESRTIIKRKNDKVLAGSINIGDFVEIQCTQISKNSTIQQIKNMVEEAQSKTTRLSRATVKIALITICVAFFVTLSVYLWRHDLMQALALWIAIIPIIFAIIIPTALSIGIVTLSKIGVLIKNAQAIEDLIYIDTIVFDKTGTLTKGALAIIEIIPVGAFDQNRLLQVGASIEHYSEHLIAKPIVKKAQELNLAVLPIDTVHIAPGRGLSGHSAEIGNIAAGNIEYMQENNIIIPATIMQLIEKRENEGFETTFIALNNTLIGMMLLSDSARDDAASTIAKLQVMRKSIIMLTGDTQIIAQKIAQQLKIDQIISDVSPQNKIQVIQKIQAQGHAVAMVGDGINDAPSMAQANVGIALSHEGIDIILQSADIILMNDNLILIPTTFHAAKKIYNIIRFNLLSAGIIHLIGSIFVITGHLDIIGSIVIHQISSMLVLINTLRLFSIKK